MASLVKRMTKHCLTTRLFDKHTADGKALWLEARRRKITGTDVAKIMGTSKWGTAYDVWRDKLNMSDPIPDNDRMLFGRLLEPVIIAEYARRNAVSVIDVGMVESSDPTKEWLAVNPDGIIVDQNGQWLYGLECKTGKVCGMPAERMWSKVGETPVVIPPDYLWQVRYCMAVCNLDRWDVVALLNGNDYRTYTIKRDMAVEEHMLEKLGNFWQYVIDKTPPL